MESFNCLSSPVMIERSSKASDRKYEERIQILFELTFITFIFVFDARFTRKDTKKSSKCQVWYRYRHHRIYYYIYKINTKKKNVITEILLQEFIKKKYIFTFVLLKTVNSPRIIFETGKLPLPPFVSTWKANRVKGMKIERYCSFRVGVVDIHPLKRTLVPWSKGKEMEQRV